MAYHLKEIFYSIQGEGAQSGRPAVFCRFSGCNLWSGLEKDRETATCNFCDTNFVGTDGERGGKHENAQSLVEAALSLWPDEAGTKPYVLLVGGEPALQVDEDLIACLHSAGAEVGIETNGTREIPVGIDWVCVSPKAGAEQLVTEGDELKLIFPQVGQDPENFLNQKFEHYFLQPMYGPKIEENMRAAFEYCRAHPKWRLSLQIQKIVQVK